MVRGRNERTMEVVQGRGVVDGKEGVGGDVALPAR